MNYKQISANTLVPDPRAGAAAGSMVSRNTANNHALVPDHSAGAAAGAMVTRNTANRHRRDLRKKMSIALSQRNIS